VSPQEYIRQALFELPRTRDKAPIPERLFALFAPMMTACQKDNSAEAMYSACGGMVEIIEPYLNGLFSREGIDAECITVNGSEDMHAYNLVRWGQEILVVDGAAAQYIPSPLDAFKDCFAFVGTRDELKEAFLQHAAKAFASGEGFTRASLEALKDLGRRTISDFPQSSAVRLWEALWGDEGVFVRGKYRPLNPAHHDIWKRELFFDRSAMARDFAARPQALEKA
jgi:hypothetical protein